MLYFNGSIIQVLEGPEDRVKALYETISKDSKHTQIITLYSDSIKDRSFSDWSMGYKTISAQELDHLKYELSFMDKSSRPMSNLESNEVQSLVDVFYRNNYRN